MYCEYTRNISSCAAAAKRMDIVLWLHKKKYLLSQSCIIHAASPGYLRLFQWLVKQSFAFTEDCIIASIMNNHIHILEDIQSRGLNISETIFNLGMLYNKTNVVEWALDKGIVFNGNVNLLIHNLEMIKMLYKRNLFRITRESIITLLGITDTFTKLNREVEKQNIDIGGQYRHSSFSNGC